MISNNEFDDWGQSAPADENGDPNGGGVDLMQVAMRRKGLIALGVFVGICLGLLYYARATPIYESVALLSVVDKAPPMTTAGRLEDAFVTTTKAEDHAIRIRTPRIINDALDIGGGELRDATSLNTEENPVEVVYEGLTVQPIQDGSEVLTLSYRGTNPEDCATVLDNILQAYDNFISQGKEDVGEQIKLWLAEANDEIKTELELRTREHAEWKQTSKLDMLDEDGTNSYQQRQLQIEQKLQDERWALEDLLVQFDLIGTGVELGTDPRALMMLAQQNTPTQSYGERTLEIERARGEIQKQLRSEDRALPLRFRDEELSQRYGEDHPLRKALREQIAIADEIYKQDTDAVGNLALTDEVKRATDKLNQYVEYLKAEIEAAKRSIEGLNADYQKQQKMAKEIAVDAAKNRNDLDEIQRLKDEYSVLMEKVAQANMLDAYGSDETVAERLQDPAPGEKVEPGLAKSLAAGVMLGFLAGFGLGYLVEMFDKTFRSPQEVSKLMQLPMVGHIPEIESEAPEGSKLSDVLVAAHTPKSPVAENFRAIRTALYFSTAGQQSRLIQMTSPVPGDGKSTITANIAVTIAQSNKNVLLLDADFRRPTQHKLFGLNNNVGLASAVAGDIDPADAIQVSEVPNLSVMACGQRPHNPSELLTSPRFAELLDHLKEQYDFVLIDTPPVLAVTDPGIVSARVDGVIMALRIRKNGRPNAMRARKILMDLEANMLGIVVNGIDHRTGSYGYYSSYRRGYGYNYAYKYGYGQDQTEKELGKYFEEPVEKEAARELEPRS